MSHLNIVIMRGVDAVCAPDPGSSWDHIPEVGVLAQHGCNNSLALLGSVDLSSCSAEAYKSSQNGCHQQGCHQIS